MDILAAVILFLAGWTFFFATLSYVFHLYEAVNSGDLQRFATARGPGWRRAWAGAWLTACAAQFTIAVTYPLFLLSPLLFPRTQRGAERQGPPVILVHGLYHNAGGWFLFARRLRRLGLGRVHAYTYLCFLTSFEDRLAMLKGQVRRACAREGEPVALVGHSLGGLLIRALLADPALDGMVRCAVTLGAPHSGSKLAALAVGELGRSLIYEGGLVQGLRERDRPAPVPALQLYSPLDNMVLPQAGLKGAPEGWTLHETPAMSHVYMLYSVWCARETAGWVTKA